MRNLSDSHLALLVIIVFPAEFKIKSSVKKANKESHALCFSVTFICFILLKTLKSTVGFIFSCHYRC